MVDSFIDYYYHLASVSMVEVTEERQTTFTNTVSQGVEIVIGEPTVSLWLCISWPNVHVLLRDTSLLASTATPVSSSDFRQWTEPSYIADVEILILSRQMTWLRQILICQTSSTYKCVNAEVNDTRSGLMWIFMFKSHI